jgi:hypothetical protein
MRGVIARLPCRSICGSGGSNGHRQIQLLNAPRAEIWYSLLNLVSGLGVEDDEVLLGVRCKSHAQHWRVGTREQKTHPLLEATAQRVGHPQDHMRARYGWTARRKSARRP